MSSDSSSDNEEFHPNVRLLSYASTINKNNKSNPRPKSNRSSKLFLGATGKKGVRFNEERMGAAAYHSYRPMRNEKTVDDDEDNESDNDNDTGNTNDNSNANESIYGNSNTGDIARDKSKIKKSKSNKGDDDYGSAEDPGLNLPTFSLAATGGTPFDDGAPIDACSQYSTSDGEMQQHEPEFYNTDSSDDNNESINNPQRYARRNSNTSGKSKNSNKSIVTNSTDPNFNDVKSLGLISPNTSRAPKDFKLPDQLPPKRKRALSLRKLFSSNSQPSASTSTSAAGGTDITDLDSNNNQRPRGIKSILRKMSLKDHDAPDLDAMGDGTSASDTFLGRVLAFSSDDGHGISGGGLAPGASKARGSITKLRNIDEELEIGMGDEDENAVELKRLNFAQLSQEAHALIKGHIPHHTLRKLEPENTPATSPTENTDSFGSDSTVTGENKEKDSAITKTENVSSSSSSFLTANPDLFIRGETNKGIDLDDDMMLDDGLGDGYVKPPSKVHAGVLSSLLRLYQNPSANKSGISSLGGLTPVESTSTSRNDFDFDSDDDDDMVSPDQLDANLPSFQNAKPKTPKKDSPNIKIAKKLKKKKANRGFSKQLRITVHIADILQRQRFILRMCKALMLYGAPTHRLEEYMTMTSRVLEIDGQFLYIPGCMIVSFGDSSTRTSEVHLVRCIQGLNLLKLTDTHKIYKLVIHDMIDVEKAAIKLEELFQRPNHFSPLWCVLIYGFGLASAAPFAFGGGWLDVPVSFGVGCCVGYLQFFVLSKLNLYLSVFEVSASIVVAFIARAIGSINNGNTFCFAAICQGLLALILPGYIILCGSLELQLRNLVAGSVRMFYAIIYLLFLGFGITLGAALYGWVDKTATSDLKCQAGHTLDAKWKLLFVPAFLLALGLINQAGWRQVPVMLAISCCGYVVSYFSGLHFLQVTEFTSALGAFAIGILGNIYLRIWKGMAVTAMLPAVFVQVPSGIASQSTLLTGIDTANKITNGTKTSTTTSSASLSFGATMVEVAIGISVGLFAAALVVYPFGKKRTGLFTL